MLYHFKLFSCINNYYNSTLKLQITLMYSQYEYASYYNTCSYVAIIHGYYPAGHNAAQLKEQ